VILENKNNVGQFSLFVKTTCSSYHNHFKEPSRFSLKNKLIAFKGLRFLEKNIPTSFRPTGPNKN
jgi:hypothetical protein